MWLKLDKAKVCLIMLLENSLDNGFGEGGGGRLFNNWAPLAQNKCICTSQSWFDSL